MKNFRHAIIVAAALTMGQTATASAASLPLPPVVEPMPIPEPVAATDYYLRSYIGITNQEIDTFTNDVIANGPFTIIDHDFDSSPFIGLGIGFVYSDRFRFDLTGEYRGKSDFDGLDSYTGCAFGAGVCTNEYTGNKSEWLFLANGYWDIGTFRGFTPYVGGGIGTAAVTLRDFRDVNQLAGAVHWASDNTEWNFAWALNAGFSYEISPDLTFDMGYRFAYLGDGKTGSFKTFVPADPGGPLTLKDIVSHDVMVGLRWNFGGDSCCDIPEAMPIPYK
ncbi:MAG TPA: porin family protein [Rhizobiales bacterium]|nr:outer membrane protein PagN precursor [bacterium BMS3Bbin10]HDO52282.1 porin family protein [Hyphomicrobiales bacterium]